jgi:DNA modification methylase
MNKPKLPYKDFLKSKIELAKPSGFKTDVGLIKFLDGTKLYPHDRDVINWAILGGKRALFESFGLHKTVQQLIIIKEILKKESGKGLIICPLGVKQEFYNDALNKLRIELEYVKTMQNCTESDKNILITNYERVRDGDIDPNNFTVVSLDEASVLRGYGTKTYQTFLQKFKNVKYKYVATATPSPNKYKELIHYAGYLGIMDTGQALTRFFKRDSTKANKLTLYPHKENEFWLWVSSWALFITRPSDLGHDDTGYDLPELKIHYHELEVDHSTAGFEKNGQGKLLRDAALSLIDSSKEKRDSIENRINKTVQIIKKEPEKHFLLWHHREDERKLLKKKIPEMKEIYGSLDIDTREKRTIDFSLGKIKYLGSKPRISGSGCNFQKYCSDMIFIGIDYKFNDFIQAIHRVYRFLQDKIVNVHIIYTESERQILDTLLKKWKQHEVMIMKMIEIIKKYGLSITNKEKILQRAFCNYYEEKISDLYTAVLGDSIIETEKMKSNSIDLIHTSIPFGNHYEYTPMYEDFGHNPGNKEFFEQMKYLSPELFRILKPGRVFACHVKDRVLFGNATGTGMPTMDPFHAFCIFHYLNYGFQYFGMITIVTDVVRENNQTYRLGWSEQCKDGSKMGVGCPEYILLFRKLPTDTSKAYADIPVKKEKVEKHKCPECEYILKQGDIIKTEKKDPLLYGRKKLKCPNCKEYVNFLSIGGYTRGKWQIDAHAFWRSNGNRLLTIEDFKDIPVKNIQSIFRRWSRKNIYDYEKHVKLSEDLDNAGKLPASFMVVAPGSWSPDVWDDVNRMLTLNGSQKRKELNMHICPLQFDIVDRIIERYSNPGELVFDPFAGLMTVPYRSILKGRKGYGIELNPISYADGLYYLEQAENEVNAPTLFDLDKELQKQEVKN